MRVGPSSALRWVKCPFKINQEHHISRQINDEEKLSRGLRWLGPATTVLAGHRGAPDVHAYNGPACQQLKAPKTLLLVDPLPLLSQTREVRDPLHRLW